jgi:dipeptidyl-peptidase-4
VPAASLIPPGQSKPLKIEDYAWSDDARRVLIFSNAKRVWRKEPRGEYRVFDLKSRELKQLGGHAAPSTLMFAAFSPDGNRAAYVSQNNLFVQALDRLPRHARIRTSLVQ